MLYCFRMTGSTRETILRVLREQGDGTVKDLAEAVGISPVSIRHHLANLQAERLITAEEVRHGVGRPYLLYKLTEQALELFPTRYFNLTNRLLSEIKESMPDEQVSQLFSSMALSMAESYAAELESLPLDQRLDRLVMLLSKEGFDAVLERHDDKVVIRELSCPYYQLGREHPEVCMIDEAFIAKALSVPVKRVSCLLDGDTHCTFAIELASMEEEAQV
jgi:DeoR family suf operon transcriptional repressor